ncbi:hypothetical protein KI387_006172 [Taxus chinensis]|uniref:Uncharacterized protein n=1 Tax=Taxus chinensis TaxID=29808 RepID=A0AA38GPE6_TAXCH|nr:hypothetical protein KI387_006172 [Taxus chinensis]
MENASHEEALGDRNCKDEQSGVGQCNNNSSEASVSPHHTDRPQALCEDTANKTVEYLRARLLAERATSKAAKEAAENNAKRLMELERMLEVETEQRKKAEEAMQEVMEILRIVRLSSASDHAGSDRAGKEKHMRKEERDDFEDGRSSNSISFGAIEETEEILEANVNNCKLQKDGHSSASSVKSVEQRTEESIDFSNNGKDEDHGQYKGFIQDQMSSIVLSSPSLQNQEIHDQMSNQRETKDDSVVLSSPSLQNQEIHDQMSNQSKTKDDGIVLSSPSLQNQEIHDQISNQSETKDDSIVLSSPSLQNQEIYDQMSKQTEAKDDCPVLSPSSLLNLDIQDQMSNQSEIKDDGMVLSSPSLQNQGIHDQKSKLSEIKDNCIVLSSSLKKQGEYYASADRGVSLSKDGLNEKCDAFQGPAPESFTNSSVAMHPRLMLEENITGLYDQMGNEAAPLAGQDQKKFLSLKLHELVDQIVCASEKEIHKYENSTLQTFNRSSKLPALESSSVQKATNDRNSRSSDFQPEVPCKEPLTGLMVWKQIRVLTEILILESRMRGQLLHPWT